jgi:carbon-monoxide dehydrogenase medium subunit
VIPAQFDCVRARTVDEAVTALGENDNAKLLAGGQSLLPILRLRLAYPDLVVDLSRTAGMWGIRDDGDALVIGGMTTHYEVMTSDLVQRHCGLLGEATSTVADPQVRHRGTFGGALSHADPAGDLPAVALAFGATMVAAGQTGGARYPRQSSSSITCRPRCNLPRYLSRCGYPSWAPAAGGGTAMRNSSVSPRPGPSWGWPRWCAVPAM